MERVYAIQQLEDARNKGERAAIMLDLPFSLLMTYQVVIERYLRSRDDKESLEYMGVALVYLRATGKGREEAALLVNSLSKQLRGLIT